MVVMLLQRSRPQLTIDEIKIYSTPRKLIRSLQDSTGSKSGYTNSLNNGVLVNQSSNEVEWKQTDIVGCDAQSQIVTANSDGRRFENEGKLGMLNNIKGSKEGQDDTESVSSTADVSESSMCEVLHGDQNILTTNNRRAKYGTIVLGFLSGAFVVLIAMIFLSMMTENDEPPCGLVPT